MAHLSAAPQPGLQLPHASPNHGVLTRAALPPAEPLLPRVNNQVGVRDFLLGRETTQLPAPPCPPPSPSATGRARVSRRLGAPTPEGPWGPGTGQAPSLPGRVHACPMWPAGQLHAEV